MLAAEHFNFIRKIIYTGIKIFLAASYIKLIGSSCANIMLILVIALFFRFFKAPFDIVVIGCSIALYMKDSLINTNSKKINQNPD
jgi:hypothetical protein